MTSNESLLLICATQGYLDAHVWAGRRLFEAKLGTGSISQGLVIVQAKEAL